MTNGHLQECWDHPIHNSCPDYKLFLKQEQENALALRRSLRTKDAELREQQENELAILRSLTQAKTESGLHFKIKDSEAPKLLPTNQPTTDVPPFQVLFTTGSQPTKELVELKDQMIASLGDIISSQAMVIQCRDTELAANRAKEMEILSQSQILRMQLEDSELKRLRLNEELELVKSQMNTF